MKYVPTLIEFQHNGILSWYKVSTEIFPPNKSRKMRNPNSKRYSCIFPPVNKNNIDIALH